MQIVSERFTNHWLLRASLRHLPFVAGILALQMLYPVDPEASTSPVSLYVLINLVAVVGLIATVAWDESRGSDVRRYAVLAALGFGLLLLNEVVTWNSETYAEDVFVLIVWVMTAVPTLYAMRCLSYPRTIAATLTFALAFQLLAFVADLLDDGALGDNTNVDWLSWIYVVASIVSIAAYQLAFLYLALRPGQTTHGWVVTARVGQKRTKLSFDVGFADADAAIAAVEKHVGSDARKLRAVAAIPASNFAMLGLEPGQVKQH